MEVLKVTDPTKIVTDPVLLAHLERQGIDKDYVELTSDYGKAIKGKSSPYAKFYRDLKSGKQFMVMQHLPMVDADGSKIEVGWAQNGGKFVEKNNLFKAAIEGKSVEIVIKNDQPDGRKTGQQLTYRAQLFLGGLEQKPVSENAALLDSDPLNSNYTTNTLEWDYGICKRRLRIIEGRLLGAWVFSENPGDEVSIRYNQSGDFKLKLGQYAKSDDEELITPEQFNKAIYPFTVNDSATFYPDAHTETSSVDGYIGQTGTNATWAAIRDGAGNGHDDSGQEVTATDIYAGTTTDRWAGMYRGIFLFNTSGLPDDTVINAATLSLYGSYKYDTAGWTPNLNIYSSAPASNSDLVNGDFDSLGTTAFCDTPLTYAGFSMAGYNDFAFNASGIAAISLTGVSKFGARNAGYDAANSPPTWSSGVRSFLNVYAAEKGAGYKPKLVVTYSEGETKTSSDSGSGAEAISLRELGTAEAGSGVEANLAAVALLAGDGGSGSEMGGLLQELFSQDAGGGADGVRILTGKAGHDLKLHPHRGQVSITHKEVNL